MKRLTLDWRLFVTTITITILSTTAIFAQKITGKVQEASNKTAIEYATVALYDESDNSLVTGVVTGTGGSFELTKLKKGSYKITVAFMGFETYTKTGISLSNGDL